jgi:hypothetical protein
MNKCKIAAGNSGLAFASVVCGMFVSMSLGFSDGGAQPGTGGGTGYGGFDLEDWFAVCVNDAPCPSSESSACVGLTAGRPCDFCEVGGARQKCVFAWTTDCWYADVGQGKAGCGHKKSGTCQGGGSGVVCVGLYDNGFCQQIKCTTQ